MSASKLVVHHRWHGDVPSLDISDVSFAKKLLLGLYSRHVELSTRTEEMVVEGGGKR